MTSTSASGLSYLYSTVRSMPSGYSEARMYPFRWNSPTGIRYMFSATNDANICTKFLFNPHVGTQVVRARLVVVP